MVQILGGCSNHPNGNSRSRPVGPKFNEEGEETLKCKIPAVLVLVVLSVAIALAQTSANTASAPSATVVSGSFSFTAFNFPGASGTRATGLNDRGDIVGDYRDSSGVPHGYLLSHGTFTSFDPPGSVLTRGLAINNLGVIGGHFLDRATCGTATC